MFIIDLKLLNQELANCPCGRDHRIDIDNIFIGLNPYKELSSALKRTANAKPLIVADKNTDEIAAKKCESALLDEQIDVKKFVFENPCLVPDESAIGRLLTEIDDRTVLISVGSGSITDIVRYIASKTHLPFYSVATAPSMDGYASSVAPLVINGFKNTFEAKCPSAIYADIDVLIKAPTRLIAAGFGDIIGKFTSMADWNLSRVINNEYYCENVAQIVNKAVKLTIDNAGGINTGEDSSMRALINALILSGVAMGLVGNSRPASGAEHHISHFWEMQALKERRPHHLHGTMVGVATVIVAHLYQSAKKSGLEIDYYPEPDVIKGYLLDAGCPIHPNEIGVSEDLFVDSVLNAMNIRPRFTILRYLSEKKMLEEITKTLSEKYYHTMK
jgi:glycerol-1-phosphate dehydrogenase [NAD(P)+]